MEKQPSKETEVEVPLNEKTKKGLGFWLAFGAVSIANLAAALDSTTLSVALPSISKDIGGKSIEAFWAGTSYPLAQTALMLLWVSLSQCFGRRPILLISVGIFGVGAILAAVSHHYTLLLVGRTVQGVGGGGLVGLTTVIITDLVPLRERGQLYAIISAVWALGVTTGPIIGGALTGANAWRWIFWLNLPIVGISILGISLCLKLNIRCRSMKEKLQELDYIGMLLFVASITAFLIPVTWGGTQYPWSSWHTLVPLCLGVSGLVGFCTWETLTKGPTLVPTWIFLNHTTTILYIGSFFHGLIIWSLVYYMNEFFQSVKSYSPLITGVAMLPQIGAVVPCAIGVGLTVNKTGRYRWAVWLGWVLTTFGLGLLMYIKVDTPIAAWVFLVFVSGAGVGLLFPSIALAIQASTPPEQAAIASTLVPWFRAFGQTLGVAIGGTIFQNRMKSNLRAIPGFEGISGDDSIGLIEYLKNIPLDSAEVLPIREAFAKSYRIIWAVMCAFAGIMMIVSFFVKEYSMNQQHLTEQGYQHDSKHTSQDLESEASG